MDLVGTGIGLENRFFCNLDDEAGLGVRHHGVASRYLSNYLGRREALDGARIKTPDAMLRAALGFSTLNANSIK